MPSASSATDRALAPWVRSTAMPRALAAATSILS